MQHQKEREKLLKIALEIYESKMVTGTWGNVSVRVNKNNMLITPSGMDYRLLKPDDMILLDFNLEIIEGNYKPSIESPMHRDVYLKREDVNAVVHVHSNYACVFAVAGESIPVVLEETAQIIGHPIEVAPYAHCGSKELASNVADHIADNNAVLLANHGLVGVGKSLNQALKVCYIAEKTAMVALHAQQIGKVTSLSPEQIDILRKDLHKYGQSKN
ncbi:hypothetical protein SYNTR_0502 [Candidatus Syntrophocurvum alkaliphilum]|uniref:Class II aldolase/adducin N-terminal domain-containing protein n=1 Tax=Candidatus Syntrophocurvum alkaliphilum TaxID=2293317 RepID=A0A6I6DCS3_9FIRM|nr:class II aldolase/adducin family protein [Candidatus Syntrophocurvum alkaliphilum]QGT99095.1 hypothetical protein SYNTR_0502 [Candidatus Syntrophocurvum alkaliphilum]